MNGSLERAKTKQESKAIVGLPLLVVGSDEEEDYVFDFWIAFNLSWAFEMIR